MDCTNVANINLPTQVRRISPPLPYGMTEPLSTDVIDNDSGYIITDTSQAQMIADMAYQERTRARSFTVELKGPGEWAQAGQVVDLVYDFGMGQQTYRCIISTATVTTSGAPMAYKTELELSWWL